MVRNHKGGYPYLNLSQKPLTSTNLRQLILFGKGNRTIADLRCGGKDIISPSTLIFAPIKG